MTVKIHPTAVVEKGAELADDVEIGAYSVIGPKVKIGRGTKILSHVVVDGRTIIGEENLIYQFASVGAAPQDLKYHGEDTYLEVGDKNTIREYTTLQPGTEGGLGYTKIGDNNLFMVSSHVGHDGVVGSNNVFANCSALAGHVTVGNCVIVGGLSAIHQFSHIGDYAMLGGGSMVNQDIPPYCMAQGDRACLVGLNLIGLQRRGFTTEQISLIKKAYREIFMGSGVFRQRLEAAREKYADNAEVMFMVQFIFDSERGVASVRRKGVEA